MCKDFAQFGPLSFSFQIEGKAYSMEDIAWDYETTLLDNIFPMTVYKGDDIKIISIVYAPISADGTKRIRGLVYGVMLENISQREIHGKVILPKTFTGDMYSDITGGDGGAGVVHLVERPAAGEDIRCKYWEDAEVALPAPLETDISLLPGEYVWVPAVISAFGDSAPNEIEEHGTLFWLNSTWSYYRRIMGRLSIKTDSFSTEFMERAIIQCLGAVNMDGEGNICGANWGTYPATRYTWMKDMYYMLLPMSMFEPVFFRQGMEWFIERSVRPQGNRSAGGVSHSLGNSLTPIVMAGLYYRYTSDGKYFTSHPEIRTKIEKILEQVLLTQQTDDVYLFPSVWISDGPAYGDWHTGTNVLAWYAFNSYSDILEKAYRDTEASKRYREIAEKIKNSLEEHCIIQGPFGLQYIEGVNIDGSIPRLFHEGEESDTTLMPFYGLLEYDDTVYRNYMNFSVSEHNLSYNPVTRGISWHAKNKAYTDATSTGFVTGLANVIDENSMNSQSGYMTEIHRLTDVDGSVWWWPYDGKGCEYGQVTRGVIGKCGWACGTFLCLFVTQILGIQFDASIRVLRLNPIIYLSDFRWKGMRMGEYNFDIELIRQENLTVVNVNNRNDEYIKLHLEVPVMKGLNVSQIMVNGRQYERIQPEYKEYLNQRLFRLEEGLLNSSSNSILIRMTDKE